MEKLYAIKWDYGYGDWGISERNLTEEEVLDWFWEMRDVYFETFAEIEFKEPILGIYSVVDADAEDNKNWMDS